MQSNSRMFLMATTAALILGVAAVARAEDVDHSKMDHSKHGGAAPTQWADPGKGIPNNAPPADMGKSDDAKAGDHAGMKHEGMDHGGMKHEGMDHGGMGKGMGGMNHGGQGGMKMNMGGMMKSMMCGFADHVEGRIAYLKAELKLTDQQTGAWNTFADGWRAAAQKATAKCDAMDKMMDHSNMDHSKPAVLHKLEMMETHMVDHLEIVRAQKSAIEPLFAALNDDQKKAASEAFASNMKVGMGGMKHEGGGMGGMNHGGGMDHGGMQH